MARRILIWDVRAPSIEDRIDDLKAAAPGFEIETCESEDALIARVEGAEVIATGNLPPEALSRARNLRWLHDWGAGMDGVLYPELAKNTVVLTCGKGNGGVTMAEWAMLLMLMWIKQAPHYVQAHSKRAWEPRPHGELSGRTVGIIGLGNSGADLASKCKAFHMRVLGTRRSNAPCPDVDRLYPPERLTEMLAESDFVVVTAPLTSESRGMLGEAEFRAMKPTAYFIVTSRGGIAQDDALLRALNERWIAGAGLDAHTVEPMPPDSPFWSAAGTFITPHFAATGEGQGARGAEIFVDNMRRYARGEPLRNVVDKRLGY